ncbi:hypothetical protein TcG_10131, partial [Trypanosoma cruzi]
MPRLGRVGRRVGCGTRIDGVGSVSRRRLSPILVLAWRLSINLRCSCPTRFRVILPFTGWRQLTDAAWSASPLRAGGWMAPSGKIDATTIHKGRRIYVPSHSSWRQQWPLPPSLHSWQHSCYMCAPHWPHGTQLTISAMHAHIKATESIILTLSLSTGSRTLPPYTHTHTIAQAAVTRSTRHIHHHL